MHKRVEEETSEPLLPWKYSIAKRMLKNDILSGRVADLTPDQVYNSREEYQQYDKTRFKSNYSNLKKQLGRDFGRAAFDNEALIVDKAARNFTPSTTYPPWHGSAAQNWLKHDINLKMHELMKPKELYETRAEYRKFPLKVFRDHIQQEVRDRKERPYWQAKAKETQQKKIQRAIKKRK